MHPDLWKMWVPSPTGDHRGKTLFLALLEVQDPRSWTRGRWQRSGARGPTLRGGGHAAPDPRTPDSALGSRLCRSGQEVPAPPLQLSWKRKGRAHLPPAGHSRTSTLQTVTAANSPPNTTPPPSARNCQLMGARKAGDHGAPDLLPKTELLTQARPQHPSSG